MKSSIVLWRAAGSLAFVATLLFMFGLIYAAQDIIYPKPSDANAASNPVPTNSAAESLPKGETMILALGDSLTRGTGDLSGDGGYVGKVRTHLEELWKKPVNVVNQAVNGWRADSLLQFMEEPDVQKLIRQADIVMLTIGANDLSQAGSTNQSDINYAEINKNLPVIEEKLNQILTKIAALNPNSKIVYVGLYNPYIKKDRNQEGSSILQQWNLKAAQIADGFPNMIVVPTFDLFQFDIQKYLYTDEFHPNSLGYDRIAARVVQALE
ncbi:GDSL-type esterase/lipase family protein [Cohnella sp. REN36]|uniref:GDSL-type esterase/lipase family protein n=1 Tax=Cohnella sp. REN36 TaxID=2887347 RepID=UPI001D15974B|nr:GDSL-type esterase/lipase family protein [Cohnella sp. REN36]MCC3372369.1 GDSL-type esterase/lipase family protein [Cohnella sp. REN36]